MNTRPNLLFALVDQLRASSLPIYGEDQMMNFTAAYAILLTGRNSGGYEQKMFPMSAG